MNEKRYQSNRKEIESYIIAKAWKDEIYKQELLADSKSVLEQEYKVQLPEEINIEVLEENTSQLYFVLPMRPDLSASELSDEQLEAIAGGATPFAVASAVATAASLGAGLGWFEDRYIK